MKLPVLHLRDIPDEGMVVDRALDAPWLAEALADTDYVPVEGRHGRAQLRLDRADRDVILSGTVTAPLATGCVRCLATIDVAVSTEFTLHLEPEPTAVRHGETELAPGELDVDYYADDTIDTNRWVREQLVLEAPAFPHCEPACAEPLVLPEAPSPAAADTVDPRLAPLKKFITKE